MAPSPSFSLPEAQLVALFLVSITYGVYLVSVGLCFRILICAEKSKKMRYRLMCLTAILFAIITTDVVLKPISLLRVFVFYKGTNSTEQQFEQLSGVIRILETVDMHLVSLLGNGMLVYRCYVIFARQFKIILVPALLWLAGLVCGDAVLWMTVSAATGGPMTSAKISHLNIALLAITLVTNILTTGLIVWRIHRVNAETSIAIALPKQRRSRLSKATQVVIESGLLYTVSVLLTLVTEATGSNAFYVVSQMMLVLIGISFNLIIIRFGQGQTARGTYDIPTADAAVATTIRFAKPDDMSDIQSHHSSKGQL